MAAQIPLIVPNGYYDKLGATTIRTPIALERMLNGPILKVNNPLWPMTNPPNKSANEADATGGRPLSSGASPMPDFNQPMGGMPAGYGGLLNSAQQQLVRMPDGTYALSPRAVSPQGMYDGTYPASSPPPGVSRVTPEGLNVYSRPTVAIGPDGNPVTMARSGGPGVGNTWANVASAPPVQTASRPAPPVSAPKTGGNFFDFLGTAFSNKQPPVYTADNPPPRAPSSPIPGGPTIDATNPIDLYRLGLSPSKPQPAALGAIDDMLGGSGRSTGQPFPLMGFNRPMMPARSGGSPLIGPRDQQWVNEGPDMAALDAITKGAKPNVALPRARPSPPQIPGAITFKKGDTVSALAKQRGMTVASFADLFGIANPNKIKAGQTVFRQAPPVPRMPPAGLSRGPVAPVPRTPSPLMQRTPASQGETFDRVWAEARG
jgi:LysM repeat protein